MVIIGIDPGSKQSAFVVWDTEEKKIKKAKVLDNLELLNYIRDAHSSVIYVAIEQIRGYGVVAGDDTFNTCEWSGRFQEAHEGKGGRVLMIPRKTIKKELCGNTTTNDKYVRQALIDRYGEVGTKKNPGKLFGISGHLWSALAVCIVAWDRYLTEWK